MDLREAEDIKRWQEYTEELYKKDLHDPDIHNDVVTHLEPGILKCKVKWAFSSVQSLSHVQLLATPRIAACQASLSTTNSWSPPKLTSIELVMPSSHLILCRPLLLLPEVFLGLRQETLASLDLCR